MIWTDDPVSDAVGYFQELDDERERAIACLPVCSCCGEPIEDDDLYDFDGELVCEECLPVYLADNHKHKVTEYIDERYL